MEQKLAETWDLTPMYDSFESKAFTDDFDKLKPLAKKILDCANSQGDPKAKILEYMKLSEEFADVSSKLHIYAELVTSTDSANKAANKYIELLEAIFVEMRPSSVIFQRWLGELSDFDSLIKDNDFDQIRFSLQETRMFAKHLLSDKEELLAAQLSQTGASAWSKLFDQLWSRHMVTLTLNGEEKEMPLAEVRNLAYDKDAQVRKTAYEAELASYPKVSIGIAAALNGIKGEVNTMSKNRGYDSSLAMTLAHSRMEQATLDAMFGAIKKYLPKFQEYLQHKAKILGHKNGLPFYDLFAPVGKAGKKFSWDETQSLIIKHFSSFSEEMGAFAKGAFDNRWVDLRPKKGKRGGAYCMPCHFISQSRILMNSTDSFDDLTTMAHELGHGFHNTKLYKEPYSNIDVPMPLAETASIFCETIIFNAALQEADESEQIAYLESAISGATQTIVDIYSRFLFESEVFEKRKGYSLDVESLNEIMINAQKKAYGKGLDQDFLHPHMWTCKPHYYFASSNFYNFPYAFGNLFALGLYAQYKKEGDSFLEKYSNLLNATGKMSVVDVGKLAEVDLNAQEFWEASLERTAQDIDKFISLTSK